MYGNTCGVNNKLNTKIPTDLAQDLTDYPTLFWANPLDLSIQVCVKECPAKISSLPTNLLSEFTHNIANWSSIFDLQVTQLVCLYGVEPSLLEVPTRCWPVFYHSKQSKRSFLDPNVLVLHRCFPSTTKNTTTNVSTTSFATEEMNKQEVSALVLADFERAWPWVASSAVS
jgi:hypothetical protein